MALLSASSLLAGCGEEGFGQFPVSADDVRDASPFYTPFEFDGGVESEDDELAAQEEAPPALPSGDPLCSELIDCLDGCETLRCDDDCYDAAPDATEARHTAYTECGVRNGCSEPGGRFHLGCMTERCEEEQTSCVGPAPEPPLGTPEGNGDLTCDLFAVCLGECPVGDGDCENDCYRASRPQVASQYAAVQECVDSCDDDDFACRASRCEDELETCYGPQLPGPQGRGSCTDLNRCVDGCVDGDRACVSGCHIEANATAFNAYYTLDACAVEAQCDFEDTDCISRACRQEWIGCFRTAPGVNGNENVNGNGNGGVANAGNGGGGTCGALNDCYNNCPEGDFGCINRCGDAASEEAHRLWNIADACVQASGCGANDGCQNQQCGQEIRACVQHMDAPGGQNLEGNNGPAEAFPSVPEGSGVSPQGDLVCSEFHQCLVACNGQRGCESACITRAHPEGYNRYVAVTNCARNNRCDLTEPGCCGNQAVMCGNHR